MSLTDAVTNEATRAALEQRSPKLRVLARHKDAFTQHYPGVVTVCIPRVDDTPQEIGWGRDSREAWDCAARALADPPAEQHPRENAS